MRDFLQQWVSYFPLSEGVRYFLPRIAIALVCGTIIGLERELKGKSAGMKTLMLVCLGSTLFSTLSVYMALQDTHVDKTRIMAQIVSGMGFLGAGVILQNKGNIIGMTSAANIWLTGGIGCVIGIGQYELAIFVSIITVFFLFTVNKFEGLLQRNYEDSIPHYYHLKLDCEPQSEIYANIQKAIKNNHGVIKHSSLKKNNNVKEIDIKYSCSPKYHEGLVSEVQSFEGIITLDLDERSKES